MRKKLWLTAETAKELKDAKKRVSFDLGRSLEKPDAKLLAKIPLDKIRENFIYCWDGKELLKLALFAKNFYKLRMWNGRPMLEIDGVRMHLVRDFRNPMEYAKEVAQKLQISKEDSVLDTCMGLGYTAIEAAKRASCVTTYEISEEVLALAQWNPWSSELFSSKSIAIMECDVFEGIKKLDDSRFSVIIHDPPGMSRAGSLYSKEFSCEMLRVSKPGARLFHYIGSALKKKRNMENEITARLESAGWTVQRCDKRLQGIFALKTK